MKNKVFSRFLRRSFLRWNSGCSWSKPGVCRTRKTGSWSHLKNWIRENTGSISHGNSSGQEKMEQRGSRGEHLSLGRGKRLQLNSRNQSPPTPHLPPRPVTAFARALRPRKALTLGAGSLRSRGAGRARTPGNPAIGRPRFHRWPRGPATESFALSRPALGRTGRKPAGFHANSAVCANIAR